MRFFKGLIVLSLVAGIVSLGGCSTQMRYLQTGIDRTLNPPVTQDFPWGQIHCGEGVVCAEVGVVRVDYEDRDGGRVEVVLQNRTSSQIGLQIAIEIIGPNGARLDYSRPENVAIQPRQNYTWQMPGIYQRGGKIRVLLRGL